MLGNSEFGKMNQSKSALRFLFSAASSLRQCKEPNRAEMYGTLCGNSSLISVAIIRKTGISAGKSGRGKILTVAGGNYLPGKFWIGIRPA